MPIAADIRRAAIAAAAAAAGARVVGEVLVVKLDAIDAHELAVCIC
jgi:hypothetical protein